VQQSRYEVPDILPDAAQDVLRGLTWDGQKRVKQPPDHWIATLADAPRFGEIPDEVRQRVATLQERMKRWI